jgi:hypothetical protein
MPMYPEGAGAMKLEFGNLAGKAIATEQAKDERADQKLVAEMRRLYSCGKFTASNGNRVSLHGDKRILSDNCGNCGKLPWEHQPSDSPSWVKDDICQSIPLRPQQFLTALWHVSLRKHGHAKLCGLMARILAEGK